MRLVTFANTSLGLWHDLKTQAQCFVTDGGGGGNVNSSGGCGQTGDLWSSTERTNGLGGGRRDSTGSQEMQVTWEGE